MTIPDTLPHVDLLDNPVRPYAWGSPTAIPELLGSPVTGEPMAELWLGGHPVAPSRLRRETGWQRLDEFVTADPLHALGPEVLARFGARLPFLLKILAVARPLSLQVHPSAAQARAGFAAEEARGIPLDDPKRNYKDPEHKPELVVAIEPFHVLAGFRPVPQTLEVLSVLDADAMTREGKSIADRPGEDGLREMVANLLQTPGEERPRLVAELLAACDRALRRGTPYDLEFATVRDLARAYPDDPGVAVALLLQRRVLAPGEALFVPAGVLHAYLSGVAVEIMASSDNVLRGGLSPKHVDVPELLAVLDVAKDPAPFAPAVSGEDLATYAPPVEEFVLHCARLRNRTVTLPGKGPRLLMCLDGEARLDSRSGRLDLARGKAAFAAAREGDVRLSGAGTVVAAGPGRIGAREREDRA